MRARLIIFTYDPDGIPMEGKAVELGSMKGAVIRDPVTGEEMFLSFEEAMRLIETGKARVVDEREVEEDDELRSIVENSNVSFDDIVGEIEPGEELEEALHGRTLMKRNEPKESATETGIVKRLPKAPGKIRKIGKVNLTIPSLNVVQRKAIASLLNKLNDELGGKIVEVAGLEVAGTPKVVVKLSEPVENSEKLKARVISIFRRVSGKVVTVEVVVPGGANEN